MIIELILAMNCIFFLKDRYVRMFLFNKYVTWFELFIFRSTYYQNIIIFYFQVRIRSMYQELLLTFSEVDEALKAKAFMLSIIIHKRPSINYSESDYGH